MENLKVEEFPRRGDGKFLSPESVVPKSIEHEIETEEEREFNPGRSAARGGMTAS